MMIMIIKKPIVPRKIIQSIEHNDVYDDVIVNEMNLLSDAEKEKKLKFHCQ